MFVEDIRERGKWQVQTFNEVRHMEYQLKSPASNPFRHIEGYYEDLSWDNYKSTAARVSGPPPDEQKKPVPPKSEFYKTQPPALLPQKASRDLPTLIQAVREIEAEKEAERSRLKAEKKAIKRTMEDVRQEEEVREAVKEEVERELQAESQKQAENQQVEGQ